jgi:energy-coupling factor transporter ATP-binding protein EcfA2
MPPDKPEKRKTKQKKPEGDQYSIPGRVARGGTVVQGPDARVEVKHIHRELSEVEIDQQRQRVERKRLQEAVGQKIADLRRMVTTPISGGGNPYRMLHPLGLSERERLVGRDEILESVQEQWQANTTVFLAGNGGSGKTSLLQAGLIPSLVADGHLPLLVQVTDEPLATSFKKLLLPDINNLPYLFKLPLSDFLRQVADALPRGKKLYLLVDRVTSFFAQAADAQEKFRSEWQLCVSSAVPQARWLFSIHLGVVYQFGFFQSDFQPNILPPLSLSDARQAILVPAQAGNIQIDPALVDEILNGLGGVHIDPAQLQLVCYTLAGGSGTLNTHWTREIYAKHRGVEGILLDWLDQTIQRFPPEERNASWQILALLDECFDTGADRAWLVKQMGYENCKSADTLRILMRLQSSYLVDLDDGRYHLASSSLRSRIQQWQETQAAVILASQAAMRQWQRVRNSALRGLVGGAVGFALLDQLIYTGPVPDLGFAIFFLISIASIGGIAGLLLIFLVDLANESFHGTKRWLCYLIGGLGGSLAISFGLGMYAIVNYVGDEMIAVLRASILEGCAWGLVAGLGVVWGMSTHRPLWQPLVGVSVVGGLVLLAMDLLFHAMGDASLIMIALAGAVLPLFLTLAALTGRPVSSGGEIS